MVASIIGILGVSSFRTSEQPDMHNTFSYIAFLPATLFGLIQTWLSYKMIPCLNSREMAHFRLFLIICNLIFFLIYVTGAIISAQGLKVPLDKFESKDILLWKESDGGYIAHCVSAIAESLFIFLATPLYASFIPEFKMIKSENERLKFEYVGQLGVENIKNENVSD